MKNILIIFFGLVISLLQISFFHSLNLIILIVLFLILLNLEDEALWLVAIAGIMLDIFSPVRFGLNIIFLLLVWGVMTGLAKRYFVKFSFLTAAWMIVLASLLFRLPWAIYFSGWWQLIINPLVNLAVGLPIFFLVSQFIKPQEKRR